MRTNQNDVLQFIERGCVNIDLFDLPAVCHLYCIGDAVGADDNISAGAGPVFLA